MTSFAGLEQGAFHEDRVRGRLVSWAYIRLQRAAGLVPGLPRRGLYSTAQGRGAHPGRTLIYPEGVALHSLIYPEGVALHSPGSRSAPWEEERTSRFYPARVTQTLWQPDPSVPDVALLVFDSVFLQQSSELVLKSLAAVMVFLRGNVLLQRL